MMQQTIKYTNTDFTDIAAACAFIRKQAKGRAVFLSVTVHAPVSGQPGETVDVWDYLKVSVPGVCEWLRDAFSPKDLQRGAMVRISYDPANVGGCLFVGAV